MARTQWLAMVVRARLPSPRILLWQRRFGWIHWADILMCYFQSRTFLISSHGEGDPEVLQSVHEDQIEKDNNDPMPFVRWVLVRVVLVIITFSCPRLIASLDRTCSTPISAKLIRSKKTSEFYDLGSSSVGSTWDSETVKMEHTKEWVGIKRSDHDVDIPRHVLSVSCGSSWEFNHTMECQVGASYNIFLTTSPAGEDVSTSFITLLDAHSSCARTSGCLRSQPRILSTSSGSSPSTLLSLWARSSSPSPAWSLPIHRPLRAWNQLFRSEHEKADYQICYVLFCRLCIWWPQQWGTWSPWSSWRSSLP